MAILFQDDFNRADNSSLGANWTELEGGGLAEINTNRARFLDTAPGGAVEPGSLLCTGHADVADVKVSVTQISATADGGPVARWDGVVLASDSSNAGRAYAVDIYPTDTIEIYRYDSGVGSTLLRTTTVTQVANGVIRLEVTGTGATVTVKQFYNGAQQGADVSDSSGSRITAAGGTGIHSFRDNLDAVGDGDYDDFLVEDFASIEDGPRQLVNRHARRPAAFMPGLAR